MTATVYRGTLLGNSTDHVQQFYSNTTGGNVRIVWYYLQMGGTYPSGCNMWAGVTTPSASTSPGDANTIKLDSLGNGNFMTGKCLGRYAANQYTSDGAGGAAGHFPNEFVLANGDKMWLFIPAQVGDAQHEFAMKYNFVAIPE